MPEVPVGDVLRSVVKTGWLRKILDLLKGIRITRGGTTIVLSEKGVPPLRGSQFDSTPHRPEPPKVGGRWPL